MTGWDQSSKWFIIASHMGYNTPNEIWSAKNQKFDLEYNFAYKMKHFLASNFSYNPTKSYSLSDWTQKSFSDTEESSS